MKKYIVLALLTTSVVKCDVIYEFGSAADAELERSYKKAKENDNHCDRVAQVINRVVTVERCEGIVRNLLCVNSKEVQKAAGAMLDDIRAELSPEDRHKFGKIIKKMRSLFELMSDSDANSERVAIQIQAKLMVINRLINPYIKACEKHVDDKKTEQSKQAVQGIAQTVFSDWKTFCAEQQKRFEEK